MSTCRKLTSACQLDDEGLKEKRRQRLMKAGYDARIRAKREKEREKEERELQVKREEEEREQDLYGWANKLRREHEVQPASQESLCFAHTCCQQSLLTKLKDRARRRVDLTDRKSAAAQARMKNIASLAAEDQKGKKRRKAGGGTSLHTPSIEVY